MIGFGMKRIKYGLKENKIYLYFNMDKFCISTLTHNGENRDIFLEMTIDTFINNTNISNIDWYILINGDSKLIEDKINFIIKKYKDLINFIIIKNEKNLGVGVGINILNEYTKKYEYVLFLEGDWITLNEEISDINKEWLNKCINFLNYNTEIDQIYLRRYLNDIDDRQFGYGYWIKPENILKDKDNFLFLKVKDYTNNPTIRRNKKFYDLEIFPLKEYFDENNNPTEIKGEKDWGQAEINVGENSKLLKTVYLKFGNFVHIDHFITYKNVTKCFINDKTCKYGFLFPIKNFCLGCDINNDFTDLESHNHYYERIILPNIDDETKLKNLIKTNFK